MVVTRNFKRVFSLYQNPLASPPLLFFFILFSETWSNKQAGGIPDRQQQVREPARACARACLRAQTDTTAGNPRAADAPACQINSHRSPRAATNVNLRKGESVQSLSAAIFTHMAHAAHARPQIGKVRRKKKSSLGSFKFMGELRSFKHVYFLLVHAANSL